MKFRSTKHTRYENGALAKPTIECNRTICIDINTNGYQGYRLVPGDGYIVSIINEDGIHPIWGNNIQMSAKPMRIERKNGNQILLKGYSVLAETPWGLTRVDLSTYGLTIDTNEYGHIEKCILHLYDRNVEIVYE